MPASALKLAQTVLVQELNGETLLVDTRSSKCFELKRSGALTLNALLSGGTAAAISELETTYKLTNETATSDVADFVDELLAAGLLEPT